MASKTLASGKKVLVGSKADPDSSNYKAPKSSSGGLKYDDVVTAQTGKSREDIAQTAVETTNRLYGGDPNITAYGGTYTPGTGGYQAPKTSATYPVVSADMAKKDLINKTAGFNQIVGGMQEQQLANTKTQAQAEATQQNQKNTEASIQPTKTLDEIKKMVAGENTDSPTTKSLQEINAKADEAYASYKNEVDQIRKGTFPLTPDQQAIVDTTQRQYDRLLEQQKVANQNFEGGMAQLGITSGRSRYAPEIQIGLVQQAVSDGLTKIADLEAKAAMTIAELRVGFQDKNYKMINDSYTQLTNYLNQKSTVINSIAQNVREEAQLALNVHKQEMDDQKVEWDKQQAAIKFVTDNNITKPFYLIGNTAINSMTGEKVSHAEFLKLTGQDPNIPEGQADYSQIQSDIQTPEERKMAYDRERNSVLDSQWAAEFGLAEDEFIADNASLLGLGGDVNSLDKDQLAQLNTIQSNIRQDPDIKGFIDVRDSYERVQTGADQNDSIGDLALIFGYMKMLDPGSVVRETEFDNAESAIGYAQKTLNIPKKFISGDRLTEEGRKHFAAVAKELYNVKKTQYDRAAEFYGGQLDMNGIPRELGIRDFTTSGATTPLEEFVQNNPGMYDKIEQLDRDNPNLTDQEILQIISNGDASKTLDLNSAFNSGGLSFDSVGNTSASINKVKGTTQTASKMQTLNSDGSAKTLASVTAQKFPANSIGGQCGTFVRKVANSFGLDYPRLGDSLTSKINTVKKYGTSLANAVKGSVIVTRENPTYGHVAWIIGRNAKGYIVAESNYKQSERVSYGRVIPYNSSKIVGIINPKKIA